MRCLFGVEGPAAGDFGSSGWAPRKMKTPSSASWLLWPNMLSSLPSVVSSASSSSLLPRSSSTGLLLLLIPRGGGARFLILYLGPSVWLREAPAGLASRRRSLGTGLGMWASGGDGKWEVGLDSRLCRLRQELRRFPIALCVEKP